MIAEGSFYSELRPDAGATQESPPDPLELWLTMERLKRFSLFEGMTDRDLGEIVRDLTFNRYEQGEVIVGAAEMGKSIYLLMEGRASLIAAGKSGREIILEKIYLVEIFGERTHHGESPSPLYPLAVADESCHVLTIPGEPLRHYFERQSWCSDICGLGGMMGFFCQGLPH